jgi:dolichol-phosphate mannosyltransferase
VSTVQETDLRAPLDTRAAAVARRTPSSAFVAERAAGAGQTTARTEALPPGARALVIIPTYNERENVERIVAEVLARDERLHVLVVDDGSPDGTGALADRIARDSEGRVHVIHRSGKLGLGTAYVAGFRWALARDYALVFEMDADFSHDPAHLPEFLSAADGADIVLGSRYQNGKVTVVNWPIARLILSYSANVYARAVTGLPVFDATGGFKCFRREVLAAIDLDDVRSNGYAFQIEMSFRAWRRGYRIAEVPIVFVDRTEGESKMSRRIVREAVWMVWRLRWWAITGRV